MIAALLTMGVACTRQGESTVPVDPDPMVESLPLGSLYMHGGVQLITEGLPARTVSLELHGRVNSAMKGILVLDPNLCSINAFGDPVMCTRIGLRGISVEVRRISLTDPAGLGRKYFEVASPELGRAVGLIVEGTLVPGELARCYLVTGSMVVPLYIGDGG